MNKKIIAYLLSFITVATVGSYNSKKVTTNNTEITKTLEEPKVPSKENFIVEEEKKDTSEEITDNVKTSFTISAVGDCTLGRDDRGDYYNSLPYFLEQNNNDYSYFFKEVYDILSTDDLTIANLESVFTNYNVRADKQFTFKATSDFINILTDGSVEAVNIANNHTYDYLETGYNDTIETLKNSPVEYFGNGIYSIVEIEGKKIGLCGIKGWNVDNACNDIDTAIAYFSENKTDLEIFSFHWGEERIYKQNQSQEQVARYAIDNGADLVLGHHPHVLQGIEQYNDKYIIYSLGNFVFGGNKNPKDKDTMIVQVTFNYENNELVNTDINIIPASISSKDEYNNYQPIVLEGERKEKVLKKVLNSSNNFNYTK